MMTEFSFWGESLFNPLCNLLDIFVLFSFVFCYHFACVIASCINVGTGVYFYWNFNISSPFPLVNLFCARYTK